MVIQEVPLGIDVDKNPSFNEIILILDDLKKYYPNIKQWMKRKYFDYIENRNKNIRFTLLKSSDFTFGIIVTQSKKKYVKISTLYVKEEYQNRGIGSFFLKKEMDYWSKHRITEFIITVSTKAEQNSPILKHFLKKFNFIQISKKVDCYIRGEDELVYLREKTESASPIVISIKPKYVKLIRTNKKKIEIRKRILNNMIKGTRAYIYESSPTCTLVGYFMVGDIKHLSPKDLWRRKEELGTSSKEFKEYCGDREKVFSIEIENFHSLQPKISLKMIKEKINNWYPPQNISYGSKELMSVIEELNV